MEPIKTCPFCGQEPTYMDNIEEDKTFAAAIVCGNSECAVNPSITMIEESERFKVQLKERIIKAWNKRGTR